MYAWHVIRGAGRRAELVDAWESLDALIAEMAASSWEEPSNEWISVVLDDGTGEAVAVALFGPGLELLVAVSDGRQLRFPVPEIYREPPGDPSAGI